MARTALEEIQKEFVIRLFSKIFYRTLLLLPRPTDSTLNLFELFRLNFILDFMQLCVCSFVFNIIKLNRNFQYHTCHAQMNDDTKKNKLLKTFFLLY